MPVTIRKRKGGKYSVRTPGGVKARGTTKEKAESQKRLLNAIEHGYEPDKARARSRLKKKMLS